MRDYFIRRLLLIPPTLVGITLIVFFITRIVPGGPIERAIAEARQADAAGGRGGSSVAAGTVLSEEQIQQMREYYGFDKPWHISYAHWAGQVVRGDLGRSYLYHEPVWVVIRSKFPISIYFGVLTVFFTYVICIPLGSTQPDNHRRREVGTARKNLGPRSCSGPPRHAHLIHWAHERCQFSPALDRGECAPRLAFSHCL
jgi:microcin C transport system permease protein